ncbi:response regulator [Hansschlegelia plantiphila]|uniref:Two-component response regulator n=1 Tax=Hansschlegelia plantiphila TaxID=374655 RepID=A0A9W6MWT2_9HYPH|nr:response regulator [Hansschlegelia plantiphila]GLK69326.1 two-component response regulator [Hansschlegelia plantiphila]
MALADTIAPHLPFLRRYARALTGRQDSGDAYVAAVLKALIADPSIFPSETDPRVGLYSIFSRIWSSVALNVETGLEGPDSERTIEALTPRSRQVFLLVSVEGFTPSEAGQILGIPEREVGQAIDDAGREIAEQVATDVLIIEDEPIIAMDLAKLVEGLGHRVIGTARTHTEALALAGRSSPGLVLADIQLADGSSGLEAVNEILPNLEVPVIFITAYPERLLSGERPEPVFLVTKPFQASTVKAIVSQALFFGAKAHSSDRRGAA